MDFLAQNFIFLAQHKGRVGVLRRKRGPQRSQLLGQPGARLAGRIERILRVRMGVPQPLDFFEIATLDGARRFGLQLAMTNQFFFPFASGFERLFAIRDFRRRGFEGEVIGLTLQPQSRKFSFQTLDRGGVRRKRFALPRDLGLKRRQSFPLPGGKRLLLRETGRKHVDLGILARNQSACVVTFLCRGGEFGRSLRQGALKRGELGNTFAILLGKGA